MHDEISRYSDVAGLAENIEGRVRSARRGFAATQELLLRAAQAITTSQAVIHRSDEAISGWVPIRPYPNSRSPL